MTRRIKAALVGGGAIALMLGLAPSPAEAVSDTVVISEVRTRGPLGGNDEFIEITNISQTESVDITGFRVDGCSATGTVRTRIVIGSESGLTVVLDPGESYLLTNDNAVGGYSGTVPGNESYGVGIADEGGVQLSGVDIVGFSEETCHEGNFEPPKASTENDEIAATREVGEPDTDDNDLDFVKATSTPTAWVP